MSASLGSSSIPGIQIEAPNGSTQIFPVEYEIVLVGSGDGNNIILRDPTIAIEHLQIDFEPDYVVATDLQSHTGTIIGSTQLVPNQPTIWPDEQVLYIGPFKLTLAQVPIDDLEPMPLEPLPVAASEPSQYEEAVGAALYAEVTSIIVEAGAPQQNTVVDVPYVIINESNETDLFSLQISRDLPPEWIAPVTPVMLAPGSQADVVVRYRIPALPPGSLGNYDFKVVAYSEHNDYRSQPLQSTLTITPNTATAGEPPLETTSEDRSRAATFDGALPFGKEDTSAEARSRDADEQDAAFEAAPVDEWEQPEATLPPLQDQWAATPRADVPDDWQDTDQYSTDQYSDEAWRNVDEETDASSSEAFSDTSRTTAFNESPDSLADVRSTRDFTAPSGSESDAYSEPADLVELSVRQLKQDGTSETFGLNKDLVVVGSGEEDDISIDEVGVLPHHIQLHIDEDDQVYVVPRSEGAGVFIGRTNAPEGERTLWEADKILRIGPFLRLDLEKSATAAALVELYPNGPQDWTVGGGRTESTSYIVANLGKRADRFRLDFSGLPTELMIASEPIELAPGSRGELTAQFIVPEGASLTAGERQIPVRAVGITHGNESNVVPASLKVLPIRSFRTTIEPRNARLNDSVSLTVENQGNEVQSYQVSWHDTKDSLNFTPEYHDFVLGPGEEQSVHFSAEVQSNRPLFGNRRYPFKATVTPEIGERVVKEGELTGYGCLPLWIFLLPLLCFICAAIPFLAQSRLNLGIDLPGIDLPSIELPGFLNDFLGIDDPVAQGDVDTAGGDAIPGPDQASANATRNASAYATAAAEVTSAAALVIAATESWLELDDDNDGLSNRQELEIGSQIDKRDTDEDGIVDGEEVNKWLTNPLSKDSDSDGINDLDEVRRSLDPRNPDTDGDGTLDGRDQAPGQAPTPTPDATKTAVAIQRATAQAGCYVDTGFDTLNLRSGPGENYNPPLVKLPNGAWLQPLAYQYPGNPQGEWIEVAVRGTEWQGWVSREWIKCNIDVTTLPSGQVPPTATPTVLATATPVNTVAVATETGTPASTATPTSTPTATEVSPIDEPTPSETQTSTSTPTDSGTDGGDSGNGTVPEPTQPPDADLANIEDVYTILKLADVATDKTIYTPGDAILLTYALQNTSGQQIKVPQPEAGAQPLVGTRQHWVERLGDDSTIPSLAESDRTDNQYRFRNEIIQATILLPTNPIITQQTLDTTGFPSGDYLITVEYRSLGGELLDSAAVGFVIE